MRRVPPRISALLWLFQRNGGCLKPKSSAKELMSSAVNVSSRTRDETNSTYLLSVGRRDEDWQLI